MTTLPLFVPLNFGFKTALIEKDKHLGGTCLNVGCIPSKALLHSTEMYHFTAGAQAHGIKIKNPAIDVSQLMAKKSATVEQLRGGIQHLMKANKIQGLSRSWQSHRQSNSSSR